MTDETFPEDVEATAAYNSWRSESNRAEREFRQATRKPRADLAMAVEEADRRRKEKIAAAKRELSKAHSEHRTAVEMARIDYRKSIQVAEATLKETMAKARAPVRVAEGAFRVASAAANREAAAVEQKAKDAYSKFTAVAYAERRRIKQEGWRVYETAQRAAHDAMLVREKGVST